MALPSVQKMKKGEGAIKRQMDKGPDANRNFDRKRKLKGEVKGIEIVSNSSSKQKPYGNSVDADGKPDWKKMRIERKNLKESRKKKEMKPEIYQLCKEAKAIWEELRKESCPENVRVKLCEQLHNLVKDNVKKLAFAHDTARVLESLLVHGTEEMRQNIHAAFTVKVDLLLLMKSKYGHFLALKLMKYASKEHRNTMFKAIEEHTVRLLRHHYASKVLNEFYSTYAKAVQRSVIIKECYEPLLRLEDVDQELKSVLEKFPQKKESIMKNLLELINFILEKGMKTSIILHYLIHQYLENCPHGERAELMETMREELVNILHTNEGSLLAISCLWHGTPKDRKVIVKSFKGFIPKIACDKYGYRVLLVTFDVVDDVVLLSKAICNEMMQNVNDLMLNQFGQRTLAYLLDHRSSFFFDPEISKLLSTGDKNEYTKKPIELRMKDVSANLEKGFLQGIVDNFGMWLGDNAACLATKLILKRYEDNDVSAALTKIAEVLVEMPTVEGIEKRSADMLTKSILFELPLEAKITFAESLLDSLGQNNNIQKWLQINRGCFTLLRIWEKCGADSEPGQEVKEIVKTNLKFIMKHQTTGGKLLKDICEA